MIAALAILAACALVALAMICLGLWTLREIQWREVRRWARLRGRR